MGGSQTSQSTSTQKVPWQVQGAQIGAADKVREFQNTGGADLSQWERANPMQVPGLSANQRNAAGWANVIAGTPGAETQQTQQIMNATRSAGQSGQATGATLAQDPSLAAAYNAFQGSTLPQIQRSYGLMGLGNSSLQGEAISRGAASQMYPAIESALQREQSAREAQIGRETGTALSAGQQYAGQAAADTARRIAQTQALAQTGATERQVGTEQAQADYQDALRRQALSEQATFGLLGQIPSAYGSQVTTKGSSK